MSILVVCLIVTFSAVAYANTPEQLRKLDAWFADIKINVNGERVTGEQQPFIVDGYTYVPLRMLATIVGMEVNWDASTYTIDLAGSNVVKALQQLVVQRNSEIAAKDKEIAELKEKITQLESKSSSTGSVDLDDLEDELNNDYGKYKNARFDIYLSGDKKDIEVRIDINLKNYSSEWNSISTSNKKTFIKNICDDITDEYPNANISGYIRDSSKGKKIHSFTISSKGVVNLSTTTTDIGALEDDLNDEYEDYFNYFDVYIILEEDGDEIVFEVEIDYDTYEDEWEDLSDSKIKTFMAYIYSDILDVFEDYYVEGYVVDEDGTTLARYTSSSFRRY